MVATVKIIPFAVPEAVVARACEAASGAACDRRRAVRRCSPSPPSFAGASVSSSRRCPGCTTPRSTARARTSACASRLSTRSSFASCASVTTRRRWPRRSRRSSPRGWTSSWCWGHRRSSTAATWSRAPWRPRAGWWTSSGCLSIPATCSSSGTWSAKGSGRRSSACPAARGRSSRRASTGCSSAWSPVSPWAAPELSALGAGGLLVDIPTRPSPRALRGETVTGEGASSVARTPAVAAIVLAAGLSRRMGGPNKLLAEVDGQPIVQRVVDTVLGVEGAAGPGGGRSRGGPGPRCARRSRGPLRHQPRVHARGSARRCARASRRSPS